MDNQKENTKATIEYGIENLKSILDEIGRASCRERVSS